MAENVGKKPGVVSRIVNRVVRIGKVTADPLLDALARVALVIDPSGGATSKAVTTVAKKSVGGMIDRFLAEPSLQKAYEDPRAAPAAADGTLPQAHRGFPRQERDEGRGSGRDGRAPRRRLCAWL
jgi:hypothetical protein